MVRGIQTAEIFQELLSFAKAALPGALNLNCVLISAAVVKNLTLRNRHCRIPLNDTSKNSSKVSIPKKVELRLAKNVFYFSLNYSSLIAAPSKLLRRD